MSHVTITCPCGTTLKVLCWAALFVTISSACAQDDGEIKTLAKGLQSKNIKIRIKSAEGLGKKGEDAALAAKDLCNALLDPSPQVVRASLEAIEKVRPDLFKPLVTLLVDQVGANRDRAVNELGRMGEKASPVIGLFLAIVKKEASVAPVPPVLARMKGSSGLSGHIFSALPRISPDDPDTIKLMKQLAGPADARIEFRQSATNYLHKWSGEDAARRKEVVPFLKAGLESGDFGFQTTCINMAASYGAGATDCLPALNKLKLSPSARMREMASTAIDKIENP